MGASGFDVDTLPKSQAYAGFLEADIASLDASDTAVRASIGAPAAKELRSLWQGRLKHLQQGHLDWVLLSGTVSPGAPPTAAEEEALRQEERDAVWGWGTLLAGGLVAAGVLAAAVLVAQHRTDAHGRPVSMGAAARSALRSVTGGSGAPAPPPALRRAPRR
jgi:ABC-type amino acid transport substrate-binding protein